MSKTPPENVSESLDPKALLTELLRTQEERDRLWAETTLLREKIVLAGGSGKDVRLPASSLSERLAELAAELGKVARDLTESVVSRPALDTELQERVERLQVELEGKKSELAIKDGELQEAQEHNDALETQIRVLEISRRVEAADAEPVDRIDFEPGDLGAQLVSALEREDQLLIRLHQMETTLSHRMADQLSLLEKDKQIQQLKYFLHQGAQDFEKLQTRNRHLEGETLQHKHRIIELQTALERSQEQSRTAARRMQEQISKQTAQVKTAESFLREAEIRQENLEDEVERLQAHIIQMEEKLAQGAGQLELLRHEASRAATLQQELEELGHEVERLETENRLLVSERDELSEHVALLEENGTELDSRVLEETRQVEELAVRMEEMATREQDLQREIDGLRSDFESRLLAASELLDEKQRFLVELEATLARTQKELVAEKEKGVRGEKLSTELQQQLDEFQRKHDSAGDRFARDLSVKDRQVQELESRCAQLQVDVTRMTAQLKESDAKKVEMTRWAEQLREELAQVQQTLESEIRKRTGSEDRMRQMEEQMPEIRRLFDVIEKQVDGFEDNLAIEEERTARLSENLDNLAGSIDSLFSRICAQVERIDSERKVLADKLDELEEENRMLQDASGDADVGEIARQQSTIQDLNTQLGIMEGDLLTLQVKMQNQILPALENLSRVSGDLEVLGMLNAAEELKRIVTGLSALIRIDK